MLEPVQPGLEFIPLGALLEARIIYLSALVQQILSLELKQQAL
jgi:hypothetical protein